MGQKSRHDAWRSGDGYDRYMGRWSRQIAPRFLDWLSVRNGLDWVEVGCGTGALSGAIVAQGEPLTLVAIDPSEDFLARARANVPDARVSFQTGIAESLPLDDASKDVAVSGLVMNFVPDRVMALGEMKRVTRPGGVTAFYVWDYPGGGVEFMRTFWRAATELDSNAADLTEDGRFGFCTRDGLADLAASAGWRPLDVTAIEAPSLFRNFEDFWHPFTLGAGPAPGYCVSLTPDARRHLRDRLFTAIPRAADGSIHMTLRAWAVKAAMV